MRFRDKEKEKLVLEFLHETTHGSGGLTKVLDKQGHLDSRRSGAFYVGLPQIWLTDESSVSWRCG